MLTLSIVPEWDSDPYSRDEVELQPSKKTVSKVGPICEKRHKQLSAMNDRQDILLH